MTLIILDAIRKDVKKLLKNYTTEEIRQTLIDIEVEEIDENKSPFC